MHQKKRSVNNFCHKKIVHSIVANGKLNQINYMKYVEQLIVNWFKCVAINKGENFEYSYDLNGNPTELNSTSLITLEISKKNIRLLIQGNVYLMLSCIN